MPSDDTDSSAPDVKTPPAATAPSFWPPTIAMLILMPAISYAMTQYVLLPHIRSAGPQNGAARTAAKSVGKSEKAPNAKESDSKGKFHYDFENLVVNLSGSMGTRYLKTTFSVYSANPDLRADIEENKKQLLDVAITVLGSRSLADLEQAGAKNLIRNDLMSHFNDALKNKLIEQIYFTEFVLQ